MSPEQHTCVNIFMEVIPEVLARYYRTPSCCFAAAAIAQEVFSHFHLEARPVIARCEVMNPVMASLYSRHGRIPLSQDEFHSWESQGAWWLSLGDRRILEPDGSKPPGHVVSIVDDPTSLIGDVIMLDPTLSQASRPRRNIFLSASSFDTVPEFLSGHLCAEYEINGCKLIYKLDPADQEFRHLSNDWKKRERIKPAVQEIVSRMEFRLEKENV